MLHYTTKVVKQSLVRYSMPNNSKAALILAYADYSHGSVVDNFFLLPELERSDKNYLKRLVNAQFNDADTIEEPIYMVQNFCKSKKILVGWIGEVSRFRKKVPSFKNFNGREKVLFGYIFPDNGQFNYMDMLSYSSFSLASEELEKMRKSSRSSMNYIESKYEIDMHEICKLFSSFNTRNKAESSNAETSNQSDKESSSPSDELGDNTNYPDTHSGNEESNPVNEKAKEGGDIKVPNNEEKIDERFLKIWAPIIYSRNYEDDYNFIHLPYDINDEERLLIRNYVNATLRSSKEMRKQSRFSCLRTGSLTLVGLSCLLENLNSERMLDPQQREVRSFLGFISRLPTGVPTLNEEHYKILGEYVISIWRNKRIMTEKTEYSAELECDSNPANSYSQQLNFDPNRCFIFGEELKSISDIWNEAFISNSPTSLCLNYPEDSLDKLSDGTLINVVPMNRLPNHHELLLSQPSEKSEVADVACKSFNQDNTKVTSRNPHDEFIDKIKSMAWWNQ